MIVLSLALATTQPSAETIERNYARWERRLRAKVTELHKFPAGADGHEIGDVVISFAIGRNGRPVDAKVRKSSGNPAYDNAARQVVSRLGRIGPVPSKSDPDHQVVLKLSYGLAPTAAADRQLTNALKAEAQAHSQRNREIVTAGDPTGKADQ